MSKVNIPEDVLWGFMNKLTREVQEYENRERNVRLRIPGHIYNIIKEDAEANECSLNEWIIKCITKDWS